MAGSSVPSSRRTHSSSAASTIDPYDQAEQGFRNALNDLTGAAPVMARLPLSGRFSLRSSDSTIAAAPGESFPLELRNRPGNGFPSQKSNPAPTAWPAACINSLKHTWARLFSPHLEPPEDYRLGYEQFHSPFYEDYPDGYPRVAAFMNSSPSFGIFRTFSYGYTRMLLLHESSLEEKFKKLAALDKEDEETKNWRLRSRYHEDGLDTTRLELQESIEKELLVYGDLMRQLKDIKSMSPAPVRDHDSVFKYLFANKPLGEGEGDWIFHHKDFVSLVPPRRSYFEQLILRHLDGWPNTIFKGIFNTSKHHDRTKNSAVRFWCDSRVKMFGRLMVVFFAVLVLFIPVILFLLTSMGRACMAVVVLAFVFIFSVMMSLLMDAGDKEMLVGTATYCAVLVTFLGNLQRNRT
ncbi:hypothetical protein DL98DRAFT_592485 [Cadophora sp. DSE1049]|nr:hypothetical protein DL98DRAFT_592485 [Cadophora sp. DSE1049]